MSNDHYCVLIRRNSDGIVRTRRRDEPWENFHVYMWTEGNFSCDCNRELEFQRAGGEEEAEERECGHEKYTAIKAILADGTEVMLDE